MLSLRPANGLFFVVGEVGFSRSLIGSLYRYIRLVLRSTVMSLSKGPSASSSNWRASTSALARSLATTRLAPRSRRGMHLALLALPCALIAVGAVPTHAQTASVGDRYSGDVYIQPAYRQAAGASGPTLTWPGKTEATAASPGFGDQMRAPAYANAAQSYRSPAPTPYQAPAIQPVAQSPVSPSPVPQMAAYQPPAYQAQGARPPVVQARGYGPAPVMPWYQRYGTGDASSAPSPAAPAPSPPQSSTPRSIYDPPAAQMPATPAPQAAAAAPTAAAANDGETARFYSLHRQYGLTPDPDPIPPQFFTQTADLSDPPGPSPVYKAATSSGGSTTSVHTLQSDEPASTLGQP